MDNFDTFLKSYALVANYGRLIGQTPPESSMMLIQKLHDFRHEYDFLRLEPAIRRGQQNFLRDFIVGDHVAVPEDVKKLDLKYSDNLMNGFDQTLHEAASYHQCGMNRVLMGGIEALAHVLREGGILQIDKIPKS